MWYWELWIEEKRNNYKSMCEIEKWIEVKRNNCTSMRGIDKWMGKK